MKIDILMAPACEISNRGFQKQKLDAARTKKRQHQHICCLKSVLGEKIFQEFNAEEYAI